LLVSRSRTLLVSLAAVAALSGCGASGSPSDQGARLQTQLTLSVHPLSGAALRPAVLDYVLTTLRHRLNAAGIGHVTIAPRASNIVVSVPSSVLARVKSLVTQIGLLRFRQVLGTADFASGAGKPGAAESPTLTRALEASFAAWNCRKNPHPTYGNDSAADYLVACDDPTDSPTYKYLLAPAAVEGTQVKEASAGLSTQATDWQVNLAFTRSGSGAWFHLTKTAYDSTDSTSSGFGSCSPPNGCNAVAITLDGVVESAPAIQSSGGIPGGLAQITGNFNETTATNLADILKYGALPARLDVVNMATPAG
jgi:preprotein translocase subunit SecD